LVRQEVLRDEDSETYGASAQTHFLYDGLGSVTDLTDDEADVAGAAGSAIIGAREAVVEGAKDLAGEVGGWLGFGKKSKPEPKPIKIRWTDEDPFPVFYPTMFQLLPPEWKCWGRYHPLVCLGIAGGAVTVGAGRTLDFWDLFLNQIDRLLGEKMRGR
jgi:hypothetical protein